MNRSSNFFINLILICGIGIVLIEAVFAGYKMFFPDKSDSISVPAPLPSSLPVTLFDKILTREIYLPINFDIFEKSTEAPGTITTPTPSITPTSQMVP